jgi:hypothetical protein
MEPHQCTVKVPEMRLAKEQKRSKQALQNTARKPCFASLLSSGIAGNCTYQQILASSLFARRWTPLTGQGAQSISR